VFAKHLPPSAGLPRVLALDQAAAAELAGLAEITPSAAPGEWPAGPFDAVVGPAAPEQLEALSSRLRPGGRLILADAAAPAALLTALTQAGLIHCLVEPQGAVTLYRGERPPAGSSIERHTQLAASIPTTAAFNASPGMTDAAAINTPFVFLLVSRTPNKPAWKLEPGEFVAWRAATLIPAAGAQPVLLAFSSLVKAVAFLQGAVLARRLAGVNKVGKFRAEASQTWPLPLTLNPDFDQVRDLEAGPLFDLDPHTAITGDE
jgi:hypothetical protein